MMVLQCKKCKLWDNYYYGNYTHNNCENCENEVIQISKKIKEGV